MKKCILLGTVIAIVTVTLASAGASAAPTIRISGYEPAYKVEVLNLGGWSSLGIYDQGDVFYTYCVEWNEYFYPGGTYYVDISTSAKRGGESVEDPLNEETAYIYTKYLNGEYSGISELDIQNAVWYLEGEGGANNSLVAEASNAVAGGQWSGIGDVRVLNLWKYYNPDTETYSGWAQDQLVTVSAVPAPGGIMLTSIGLLTVKWLRRRKRL
jgi:hypothetical protein